MYYFSNSFMLSSITDVPSTTHVNGESAIFIGTFNSCAKSLSIPFISAPPPVTTIPLFTISADNSGIVSSKTCFAAFIIFAAGTGNPYFSTDTGIALRTLETDADIVLMGKTGVDGIYSSDPRIDANAERFEKISFDQALEKNLQVMDQTAVCLMRNSHAKILVFNANRKNCYIDVMEEKIPYTIVYSKDEVK